MIWYSHVNEDSIAERNYAHDFSTLFCVVGSGERVLALLDMPNLKQVYAVDTNIDALHLLKLKLVALTELEIQDYLGFIGANKMAIGTRMILFDACLQKLDPSSKLFWNSKRNLVKRGILFVGHYEHFLSRIRPLLKFLLGLSFYKIFRDDYQNFPSLRWGLVKFFFSNKLVYKLMGNKDLSFVGEGTDVTLVPTAFQQLIDANEVNNSFMVHLVFKGHLHDLPSDILPPSLNPEVLRNVQDRLRNKQIQIKYKHNDILKILKKWTINFKDDNIFCSISDILSFEKPEYVIGCLKTLSLCKPQSVAFVIRSYLKNHLNSAQIQEIKSLGFTVENITYLDKTNMYKVHLIKKK